MDDRCRKRVAAAGAELDAAKTKADRLAEVRDRYQDIHYWDGDPKAAKRLSALWTRTNRAKHADRFPEARGAINRALRRLDAAEVRCDLARRR